MLKSLRARWLSVSLVLFGCSAGTGEGNRSLPANGTSVSGASGTAGQSLGSATGGAPASGGFAGSGGSTMVSAGTPCNASGSGGASAGSNASGGLAAGSSSGGSSGGGGGPTGGKTSGGGSGGNGGGGGSAAAPTFTMIYDRIITPTCGGAQCHLKRPTPFGYDFSSKSAASASFRADVISGDAENSPMFQVLNFAIMPKDRPPLSVEQLYLVYDWINAGALDN